MTGYRVGDRIRVIAHDGSGHGAKIGTLDTIEEIDLNPKTSMPVKGGWYWYALSEIEPAPSVPVQAPFQAGDLVRIKSLGIRATIDEIVLGVDSYKTPYIVGYRLSGGVTPVVVGPDQIERVE